MSAERDGIESLAALLESARRGGFVLRTPFRRRELDVARTRALALRVASRLRREGLAAPQRVILWGVSGPEWIAAFLGSMLRGCPVIPLDDAAGPEFAARVQREAGARFAFVGRAAEPAAAGALADVPRLVLEDLETALEGEAPHEEDLAPPDDGAVLEIVFTSGTTSEPKGVVITHQNVLTILRAIDRPYRRWNRRLGWLVRTRPIVVLLPLSHLYGQAVGIFIPLMMGLRATFVAPQGPAAIREALRGEGAFVLSCVPRFLTSLREHVESQVPGGAAYCAGRRARHESAGLVHRAVASRKFRRLLGRRFCTVIVGGAGLDAREEDAWKGMGYLVSQGYGLTETAPIVTLSNPFTKGRGKVGKPLRGQEVRLSPEGEILVRGANVSVGYLEQGGVRSVVDEEGWFHTGDLGRFDERGSLHVVGRLKDVIVTPEGLNIHARDVEEALSRDIRVKEGVVIGLPVAAGDEVHAVLVLAGGGDTDEAAAEVVRDANAALPAYQRIRSWTRWIGADLPRTSSTGKVKKRELIAAVMGGASPGSCAMTSADGLAAALRALGGEGDAAATRLSDLGLSSLETVELVSRLEGEFQAVIDESRLRPDMTLAELRTLVSGGDVAPPPRIDMPRWARTRWARVVGALLRAGLGEPALRFSSRPLVVRGREHLAQLEGPALFVGNHASILDAPLVFHALPRNMRSRVATAMGIHPFAPLFTDGGSRAQRAWQRFRYTLAVLAFQAFPLPRASGFRASLEYAGELADHGISTLIFPEGRMSPTGDVESFRGGAGLLAKELRLPVVPFRTLGLTEVLPPDRRWPRPGRVELVFGEPLPANASLTAQEWVERMEAAVRALA